MNGLALFAGVGGLELGVNLIIPHSRTVCFVEGEAYNVEVLQNKIEKKQLEEALIFSDVRAFRQICYVFSGKVDFITAGFPCQPFSTAGDRKGTKDERWLWGSILEIISQVRPSFLFLENVSNLINEWGAFDEISKSLSKIGFSLEWGTLRASEVGANHHRNRLFIFAYKPESLKFLNPILPHSNQIGWNKELSNIRGGECDVIGGSNDVNPNSKRRKELDYAKESIKESRQFDKSNNSSGNVPDSSCYGSRKNANGFTLAKSGNDANANSFNTTERREYEIDEESCSKWKNNQRRSQNNSGEGCIQKSRKIEKNRISRFAEFGINQAAWWQNEPRIRRVVDGVAFGMDRIRACGNGVVPLQAAMAYYTLINRAKSNFEVKS